MKKFISILIVPLLAASIGGQVKTTGGAKITGGAKMSTVVGTPSFPSASELDDFNRADTTGLGSNWTAGLLNGFLTLDVVSNTARHAAASNSSFGDYWNVATFGPNVDAWATLAVITAGNLRVAARLQSPATAGVDGYLVRAFKGTSTVELYRVDDNTETSLATGITQTISVGDSLGIRCNGTSIESWYKVGAGAWTQLQAVTDATYGSAGNVGFALGNNNAANNSAVDAISAGTF